MLLTLKSATFTVLTALLPAESRATASIVCVPPVEDAVFQLTVYGGVVISAPRFTPSTMNCTPATATLSDAVADTVTMPETAEEAAGAVRETEGGVVSPDMGGGVGAGVGVGALPPPPPDGGITGAGVGAGGGGATGAPETADAGEALRMARVILPTCPIGSRLLRRWNVVTAALVALPK